jgi:N-acetylmuramic acid 6-phosphate (MurNAc-6-P) etherase
MDATLEKEHPKFMELSQLCNDLVRRFDSENMPAAAKIRKQFDSVTQNWENIVTRLEEQSQMVSFT